MAGGGAGGVAGGVDGGVAGGKGSSLELLPGSLPDPPPGSPHPPFDGFKASKAALNSLRKSSVNIPSQTWVSSSSEP